MHLYVRIKFDKLLHPVGQPARTQSHRCGDPKPAGRIVCGLGKTNTYCLKLEQYIMGCAIEKFALFGHDQATGMAVKQRNANILLQSTDLSRDRGLGQMEFLGCMGE